LVVGGDASFTIDQSTIYAGNAADSAGGDSLAIVGALSQSSVYGSAGADTLNINGTTAASSGAYYAGDGNDSINIAALNGSSVFGGASSGDTASGNDTLEFAGHVTGAEIFMGSSSAYITSSASTLTKTTITGGDGKDTLTFTGGISSSGSTASLIKSGGGIDSLTFNGGFSASKLNAGAGADHVSFGSLVRGASSLAGGAGNDTFYFAGQLSALANNTSTVNYFYQGGADSFNFATANTNTGGAAINFYYDSTVYDNVATSTSGTTTVYVKDGDTTIATFNNIQTGIVVLNSTLDTSGIAAIF
jgi:Ca2+-binding RTX toxin-like protein